jgi:hypothetical protein
MRDYMVTYCGKPEHKQRKTLAELVMFSTPAYGFAQSSYAKPQVTKAFSQFVPPRFPALSAQVLTEARGHLSAVSTGPIIITTKDIFKKLLIVRSA